MNGTSIWECTSPPVLMTIDAGGAPKSKTLTKNVNVLCLFFLCCCHSMDDCVVTMLLAAINQSAMTTIDYDFISHICFVVEQKNTCGDEVVAVGSSFKLVREDLELGSTEYHTSYKDVIMQPDGSDTVDFLINVDDIARTQYDQIVNDQFLIYFEYFQTSNVGDTMG